MKKILFAASECVPFIKTGGLADVVGSLPENFNRKEFDVRVILPKYACMNPSLKNRLSFDTKFYMDYNYKNRYVGILETKLSGITYYFVDNEEYFGGPSPYTDDGLWDIERFGFFSKAVIYFLREAAYRPDIIHCHDWQSALIPVYLDEIRFSDAGYKDIRTVMTIHNLKFQGTWEKSRVQDITGLSRYYFTSDKLEAYGDANLLKGGIVYADKITTVSKTYAREIKYPFYGEGLDGLLRARDNSLVGILNGIDYDEYNPMTDPNLKARYHIDNFRRQKVKNKIALQEELGLPVDPHVMMIGIVSRLTAQKGLDLIGRVMDELCADGINFVILGTGDHEYEDMFRYFAGKYPDKVSANICYSDPLSKKIYGSCDALLMPSLFEPCGLSQIMALRFGTLPIVRETGGLKDTVEPYNEYFKTGTGFSFANFNAHEMMSTVRYAEHIYYDKKREWNRIVERAMSMDFSWKKSAKRYEELYLTM